MLAGDLTRPPPGVSTGTFGPGISFSVDFSEDSVLRELFFLKHKPPALARILDAVLGPGCCFYDVGANIGVYTLWASKLVGVTGEVHAFEPVPRTTRLLRDIVAHNRAANVTVVAAAAADHDGTLVLSSPRGASGLSSAVVTKVGYETDTVEAPAVTLDSYAAGARPPDLVKIDVEGFEPAVFAGMSRLLAEQAPLVVFEADDGHFAGAGAPVQAIAAELAIHGYELWNLGRRGLEPVRPGRPHTENLLAAHPRRHRSELERLSILHYPRNQSL